MNIICICRYFSLVIIMVFCDCGNNAVLVSSDTRNDLDPGEESLTDQNDMVPCQRKEDCSNGLVCDGEERCEEGACVAGDPPVCDDGNECTDDFCSEEAGECEFVIHDEDGDGFGDASCGGTDCDDSRDDVYPGAPESCQPGEDRDCSGTPDLDDDQDGYIDGRCPDGDDCDDMDPGTHPDAPEICLDGKDQDCDRVVDGPMLMVPNVKISEWGSDGSTRTIVWTGSEFGIAYDGWNYRIYFTRVSGDGTVIDEEKPVMEAGYSYRPSMVWTGSEYAIAFQNDGGSDAVNIYYLRLSDHGIKIDEEIQLTDVPRTFAELIPSLVWTGSLLGMTWHRETLDGTEWYSYVYFQEFDVSGVDASEEIVLNEHEDGRNPQLVWIGSEFGITWKWDDIFYSHVNAEGIRLTDPIRQTSLTYDMLHFIRTEWTGSEFGIAWSDRRVEGGTSQIYFSSFRPDGTKDDPDIMLSDPAQYAINPQIIWTGSEFAVAWVGSHACCDESALKLFFDRITTGGNETGNEIALTDATDGDFSPVDLVWTGSEFGVVWVWTPLDSRNGTYFNRIGFCD
jgi:hypothetical protein